MTQAKIHNKTKFLDGEVLFKKWIGMGKAGSISKLVEFCKSEGIRNPRTGKPPTRMGLWCTMWRWAIKNLDASRPMYARYVLEFGDSLTDEEWWSLVESRAKELLTLAGYKRFISKNPKAQAYSRGTINRWD